ncbi:MAG TPA: efflux RND transporter periplasmic adaptor subunit, partial [Polyangiales bacterium]|nr:efflux RND transporter periplasmic adaptor subunit [Polyangiales bacterium]
MLSVLAALCSLAACEPSKQAQPGAQQGQPGQGQGQGEPPQVLFSKVTKRDWASYLEAVASLDGYVNADIRARVRGYLSTQDYKEGGYVKVNQRLFTIERTEQESAVASANATLARANAAAERTRSQLARVQALFNSGAISQQQIDDATAAAADAQAQVEGARAQLKQAQLNLSYTELRSPLTG